jgi:hypothetical protein
MTLELVFVDAAGNFRHVQVSEAPPPEEARKELEKRGCDVWFVEEVSPDDLKI